jgi:hypothetical protein
MKKIYNIIDSELTQNQQSQTRQEFGEVGTSESISLMEPLQSLPQKR